MCYIHRPVMVKEVLNFLSPQRGGFYVDATCGEGGHSEAILKALPDDATLLCLDRDAEILDVARNRFEHDHRVIFQHASYADLPGILERLNRRADGLLLDLGLSSYHLEHPERGFSFVSPVLDMRYDRNEGSDAFSFLHRMDERSLARILREFGEERGAGRLAAAIYHALRRGRLKSCADLALLIERISPRRGRIHPATRTFQAIRIAVNNELDHLQRLLRALPSILGKHGRFVAISYHSLEDRLIKRALRGYSAEGRIKILTKKVVKASSEEVAMNRRARSARLRAAEAME